MMDLFTGFFLTDWQEEEDASQICVCCFDYCKFLFRSQCTSPSWVTFVVIIATFVQPRRNYSSPIHLRFFHQARSNIIFSLLLYSRKVNKCYRGRSCPIIVHCRQVYLLGVCVLQLYILKSTLGPLLFIPLSVSYVNNAAQAYWMVDHSISHLVELVNQLWLACIKHQVSVRPLLIVTSC